MSQAAKLTTSRRPPLPSFRAGTRSRMPEGGGPARTPEEQAFHDGQTDLEAAAATDEGRKRWYRAGLCLERAVAATAVYVGNVFQREHRNMLNTFAASRSHALSSNILMEIIIPSCSSRSQCRSFIMPSITASTSCVIMAVAIALLQSWLDMQPIV